MRKGFYWTLLLTSLLTTHCDRNRAAPETQQAPPPVTTPETPNTKVRLYLFGAGNCNPCKEELPEVQKWLETKMAEKKDRILPLFIFTAGQAGKPATQADAEQFLKDLGVSFETVADKFGRTYYRQYYKEGNTVPATVLLKENKEVIKVYPREKIKLDVLEADINDFLK